MISVGERVGAIFREEDDGSVLFLGYGEYVGLKAAPSGVITYGVELHRVGGQAHCIRLDNGDEVYGCECWWGTEEEARKRLEGKVVREVRMPMLRGENRCLYTEEELVEAAERDRWRGGRP